MSLEVGSKSQEPRPLCSLCFALVFPDVKHQLASCSCVMRSPRLSPLGTTAQAQISPVALSFLPSHLPPAFSAGTRSNCASLPKPGFCSSCAQAHVCILFQSTVVRQHVPPTVQVPLLHQANTPSSGSADQQSAKGQCRHCHPEPGQLRLHSDRGVTIVSRSGVMASWDKM